VRRPRRPKWLASLPPTDGIQRVETLADHAIVNGTEEAVLSGDDVIEADAGEGVPLGKDSLDGEEPVDGASPRVSSA
jgi:hypothetical protein